jgi:hypothetical protein
MMGPDRPRTPNPGASTPDLAATPAPLEYRILWERVTGHTKNTELIEAIRSVYLRRNRKEQKIYGKLVLRAMRLGLIERNVPEGEANPSTPEVAPE